MNGKRPLASAICITVLMAVMTPAFAAPAVDFAPAVNYPVGNQPLAVAADDFDGDDDVDLAVTNVDSESVSFLINHGDGSFDPALNLSIGLRTFGIAAADMDGDNVADLVVCGHLPGGAAGVKVLMNNGTGGFFEGSVRSSHGFPFFMATADLDDDGDNDAAVADRRHDGEVWVMVNDGSGTFTAIQRYPTGIEPYSVRIADFDGDGDFELAVPNHHSENVTVLWNDGSGQFPDITHHDATTDLSDVAPINVDGDWDLDLVTSHEYSGDLLVLEKNGYRRFTAMTPFHVRQGVGSLVPADFNDDGFIDLGVGIAYESNVRVLVNDRAGAFGTPLVFATGSNPAHVIAPDVNGDDRPDIVTANSGSNDVSVLLNIPPSPIYVDADAPGAANGSSWADAYTSLSSALAAATVGDEIRVAQGVYTPDGPNRESSFELVDGAVVRGGYAGYGEPDPDARDVEAHETILSGDLLRDDHLHHANNAENCYHVVVADAVRPGTVLDGFTITGGNANGADTYPNKFGRGGGVYNNSELTMVDCTIKHNCARRGGGMYCGPTSAVSYPVLIDCRLIENEAEEGGAMWVGDSDPKMTRVHLFNNRAESFGGAIMFGNDNFTEMFGCMFVGNSAGEHGGALYCMFSFNWLAENCTFSHNSAQFKGGAVFNDWDVYETFRHCTFVDNKAQNGGGMYNNEVDQPTIESCILWRNRDDGGMDESAQFDGPTSPNITFSCVQGWTGIIGGPDMINLDPLFVGWGPRGEIYVDEANTGPADGTLAHPYPTIREVIGAEANWGWSLRLSDGSPCIGTGAGGSNMGADHGVGGASGAGPMTLYAAMGEYDLETCNFINHVSLIGPDYDIVTVVGTVRGLRGGALLQDVTVVGARQWAIDVDFPEEPTINNVWIVGNATAYGEGYSYAGGVNITANAGPLIRRVWIFDNGGQGITCNYGSYPAIDSCRIMNNGGRGIRSEGGSRATITQCRISGNRDGGVFFGAHSISAIRDSLIEGNTAQARGGGIQCWSAETEVNRCRILNNRATEGGGVYIGWRGNLDMRNCLLAGNEGDLYGGGVAFGQYSQGTILNSTIADNQGTMGMAISCHSPLQDQPGTVTAKNCILWNGTDEVYNNEGSAVSIDHSIILGGWPGTANLDADPKFVAAGDYRLGVGSPAIDSGDNAAVPPEMTVDLAGDPRIQSGTVDRGAYESPAGAEPRQLYVDDDAPGDPGPGDPTVSDPLEDGTLAHPFDAIQEAIDAAVGGDTVIVLDGTFTGPGNRDIEFHGKAITVRSKNGPANCVVDAQGTETEPHRGFTLTHDESEDAVLEGFTITGGNASGPSWLDVESGGGILCYGLLTIRNNVITGNTASGDGGGITAWGSPTIENNTIVENTADFGGGVNASEWAIIINNTISRNTAIIGGGIWTWEDCPSTIINNVITENQAGYDGGGIGVSWDYYTIIVGNLIARNTAGDQGGGIYLATDPLLIANNTIVENSAVSGGGIYSLGLWSAEIVNNILWGNGDDLEGCSATYSCIEDGDPGEGNISGSPQFVDASSGNYNLQPGSPCIDVGRNDALPNDAADLDDDGDTTETLPLDLVDRPRVAGGAVDMGACEFQTARELYVDDDAPGDPGPGDPTVSDPLEDGTPAHPFDAIQEAIDAAANGDTAIVLDGTYTGPGNHDVDFLGKAITVRSRNGPADCIVDGEGDGSLFHFRNSESRDSVLDGFTVIRGRGEGGGVRCSYSSPTLVDCVFSSHTTGNMGAGVYNEGGAPRLVGCIFRGNISSNLGAGWGSHGGRPELINCLFSRNTANYGGAFFADNGDLSLVNCTLVGNRAREECGGILSDGAHISLTNCIFWNNRDENGTNEGAQIDDGPFTVNHSCIQGWSGGWGGTGNHGQQPLFVDPGYWDDGGLPGDPSDGEWIEGNYRLQAGSPCRDCGDNTAIPAGVAVDLDGSPRIANGVVDMGAYEFGSGPPPPARLYVDVDATGANTGTSWEDAFNDLQDALRLAAGSGGAVQEIWVAEGTYRPGPPPHRDHANPRDVSFELVDGVAVYGGFEGVETELGQRDVAANETILSGDLNGNDGPDFANNSENSFHVVVVMDTGPATVLDGFTVTGGNANGPYGTGNNQGGGMVIDGGEPTVANCLFTRNCAGIEGSGGGGGMFNASGNPTLIGCVFRANQAKNAGALSTSGPDTMVISCAFVENSAVSGGAVTGEGTFVNCRFSGNTADWGGGALSTSMCDLALINCTFHGNRSAESGGAIHFGVEVHAVMHNSILWGNSAPRGPQVSISNEHHETELIITHSDIEGSTPGLFYYPQNPNPYTWGAGNTDADPAFVAPGHWDDAGTTEPADDAWIDGDYRLQGGSVCLDCGDNTAIPAGVTEDLGGRPRIQNGVVDMGAYESTPPSSLEASVCIHPRTLNRKSKGRWVTCWIELPAGNDPRDIDVASLRLNGVVPAAPHPSAVGDHDEDGIADLMVKFPRDEVIAILDIGDSVEITVTGHVGGEEFAGADAIRVIDPGIGPQSAIPRWPLEFGAAVLAEGLTGSVAYRAENLPAGAVLDERTGRFHWTPTADQIGVYPNVTFCVTDGIEQIVDIITIRVEASTAVRPGRWLGYR